MNQTAALADHLDERADAILAVWKAAVTGRGDLPDASKLSDLELTDHVPELLDRIADRLRGREAGLDAVAQVHGRIRWRQGYDLAEVVAEIGVLRSTLFDATFAHAAESADGPDAIGRYVAAISGVLDEALAESVRQFEDDASEATDAMLDQVERRNRAAAADRARLMAVLDRLPIGVWVVDRDGTFASVNREAVRLQGFSEADAIEQVDVHRFETHYDLAHPDGTPVTAEALPALKALRGEVVGEEELRWIVDGQARSILTNAAPLVDPDGAISGAIVVAQDVTERAELKAELAASELRFRTIVERSPVMIWRSDPSGRRDFFNRTWLDFRGRSEAQEAGDGWAEGVHPDDADRRAAHYQAASELREPVEVTYRLLRRDGVYRSVLDRGTPYSASGEFLGYLGSCLDITERVEVETSLGRQSEHKSRLMASLSHDARTPLNAVVLAAQLLETQVKDQDDVEVQESLRMIRDSVRNLLDLLSDLLDLTRIDAGATPTMVSQFPVESTLIECLSSIEPQARAKGLEVVFEPGGLAGSYLATDRNKLKQILANFLSNALRYTERGRIRLSGAVTADHVRIGVEDSGVGIDPVDQVRIFDEFATLAKGHRRPGEGTGLGLAICRRLADLIHGEIQIESVPGRGSTFTLALPASQLVDGRGSVVAEPVAESSPLAGPILIVEDHEPSRRALARVIQRLGHRVLEAGDGREAIDLCRDERPSVVLMDVNMPGMDGIEATRALRADPRTRDLPIFALTGDVTVLNQRRIGEAGVDGYIEKPVSWEMIERALARLGDRIPPAR